MRAVILLVAVLPAWIAWHVVSGPGSTAATWCFTSRPQLYLFPAGVCRIRIENGIRGHTAVAAHAVPATPSPAAVTAFYRRAEERTAKLMGRPAPNWKVCPSCKLAFHGPNTLAENPATGHTPGDWQP